MNIPYARSKLISKITEEHVLVQIPNNGYAVYDITGKIPILVATTTHTIIDGGNSLTMVKPGVVLSIGGWSSSKQLVSAYMYHITWDGIEIKITRIGTFEGGPIMYHNAVQLRTKEIIVTGGLGPNRKSNNGSTRLRSNINNACYAVDGENGNVISKSQFADSNIKLLHDAACLLLDGRYLTTGGLTSYHDSDTNTSTNIYGNYAHVFTWLLVNENKYIDAAIIPISDVPVALSTANKLLVGAIYNNKIHGSVNVLSDVTHKHPEPTLAVEYGNEEVKDVSTVNFILENSPLIINGEDINTTMFKVADKHLHAMALLPTGSVLLAGGSSLDDGFCDCYILQNKSSGFRMIPDKLPFSKPMLHFGMVGTKWGIVTAGADLDGSNFEIHTINVIE